MTGRVCPVHGEYAPTGICRWCEPGDAAHLKALNAPLYAEVPAPGDLSEVMVGLSVRLPPAPTYLGAPVFVPGWSVNSLADEPPMLVSWALTEKTADAYRWRLEWREVKDSEEYDYARRNRYRRGLLAQHAALRWERVARRWNYKHRSPGGLDEAGRRYVWLRWTQRGHP